MTALHDSTPIATRSDEGLLRILRLFRYIVAAPTMPFTLLRHHLKSGSRRRRAEREFRALPDAILGDIGIARSAFPRITAEPSERRRGNGNMYRAKPQQSAACWRHYQD